jgi:hypothetical protein
MILLDNKCILRASAAEDGRQRAQNSKLRETAFSSKLCAYLSTWIV